jgi:hypothetical protein
MPISPGDYLRGLSSADRFFQMVYHWSGDLLWNHLFCSGYNILRSAGDVSGLLNSFFEPISDLAEKFDILQSATAAGEKILSVLNAPAAKNPFYTVNLKSS